MHRTTLLSVVFVGVFAGFPLAQQQQPQPSAARTITYAAAPMSAEALSGVWDYNAELSVDAATGRPEQAPRSAAARPAAPGGAGGTTAGRAGGVSPRPPTDPAGGGGGGGGSRGGDGFDDARRAMAAVIAAERRTLLRDLLEIPETLTIRATTSGVTFIDDLKRERTYETDGKPRKYQISAARFEAKGIWQGAYFRKDIEGPNNFKMTETYFLSEDKRRLFVIIRIGDPKKPETMAGVNRVYDRIGSTPQSAG
jgi:hypothetical protein